jgi:hypothetical protein
MIKSMLLSVFVVSMMVFAFMPVANANSHSFTDYCKYGHGSSVTAKVTADIIGGKCYNCAWYFERVSKNGCTYTGNLNFEIYAGNNAPICSSVSGSSYSGSTYGPYDTIRGYAYSTFTYSGIGTHVITSGGTPDLP